MSRELNAEFEERCVNFAISALQIFGAGVTKKQKKPTNGEHSAVNVSSYHIFDSL
jgi:hypothetical protein